MSRIAFVLLMFIAFSSCSEAQTNGGEGRTKKVIPASEFKSMLEEDIQLIDVRTMQEVAAGKIADAQNIDFNSANFKAELEKLDKSKKTLVYCAAGGRSGKAAQIMQDMGFEAVYDLEGGYGNWPYK